MFSHIYEFFLQSFCTYLLLKDSKTCFLEKSSAGFIILIGAVIGLICLVRYNNILSAFMWPVVLFCLKDKGFEWKNNINKLLIIYGVAGLLIFVFKVFPILYNHAGEGYTALALNAIINADLLTTAVRLWNVFFSLGFGIIFTSPFAFAGLMWMFLFKGPLKKQTIWLFMPLTINLFFSITWPGTTQGCWYGYRYFLFSLIPLLVLPFALLITELEKRYGEKNLIFILSCIAAVPLLSMISFDGNNTTLTLSPREGLGWCNPSYHLEILKMIIFHPVEYAIVLSKGCLFYLIYLSAHLTHFDSRLPAIMLEKYPAFSRIVLVKAAVMSMFPEFMFLLLKKYGKYFTKL